ncbi:putative damage-inducible protein DinB [Nocardiopsis arvandica]|uniref:Putative damage-inducible protein DinB n=1 Tax=Nocardiopsis sinuspersici TaxID=501010 RepID=A0A7Z0BHF5_9ACTN|nr:DinB family protein [Nocardiopsis sinuspersici]NYH50956.1 putative damage-inducible protein DinB [Nocardiopsis sinuspersici]
MSDENASPSVPGRVAPPKSADERTMLTTWLEWHRATVHAKCADLSAEHAVATPLPTSPLMSVGAVVSHLRWVEHAWFEMVLMGLPDQGYATPQDPDAEWRRGGEVPLGRLLDEYEDQCARSREITAKLELDAVAASPRQDEDPTTLRWVLLHMIEETARHNGHLDVLRELADGTTGE